MARPAQRSSGAPAPGVWSPARPGALPFGLAVFFSLWLHAGLLALIWAAPRGAGVSLAAPAIGRVALVSLPPPPAPAAPAPPEADRVVLPEKPTAPPGRAQPQPDPEPEPEPREPESYEDVLNRLRAEAGEPVPDAAPTASAAPRAAPPGRLASPEVLLWSRRAKVHVTRSWVLGPDMQARVLEAEVAVLLGAQGQVMSISIRRSSGDAWFDASVERAIGKASPLPPPPEAGVWVFRFRPRDVL